MATIPEALAVALQYLEASHWQQAEAIYQQILQVDPGNADALHWLGLLAAQVGKHDLAVEYISQAIAICPSNAVLYNNLGEAYRAQGQLAKAVAQYQEAIRLNPNFAEVRNSLGSALRQQGQLAAAVAQYQEAIRLKPDYAKAHYNLGLALSDQGQLTAAVAQYQEAIGLKPDYAEAYSNLGVVLMEQGRSTEAVAHYQEAIRLKPDYAEAHNNLGNALREQGQLAAAVAHCQEAIRLKPDYAVAHSNLGLALQDQGDLESAVVQYQEAIRLQPDYAEAHTYLGNALQEQGQLTAAMAEHQEALRLKPDLPGAHNNLGNVLQAQGQLAAAVAQYQEAIRLKPDYGDAHWNRALAWLLAGDFERGWPAFEWRWQTKLLSGSKRSFPQPLWDGSSLAGRTILLHAEQGLGDTIQFVRYVPLVKKKGGMVILECQPALRRLLESCAGVDQLVPRGASLPPFDVHAPLLSLPGIFGTTLSTIPAGVPYLFADTDLVEQWRHLIKGKGERMKDDLDGLTHPSSFSPHPFRVGIAWQAQPSLAQPQCRVFGARRSICLAQFEPLARLPGVRLFSLQKGYGTEQMTDQQAQFSVITLGSDPDEGSGPFMDTAAVMKHLNLVVSADTAVAHCAGALGVPVWVPYHSHRIGAGC